MLRVGRTACHLACGPGGMERGELPVPPTQKSAANTGNPERAGDPLLTRNAAQTTRNAVSGTFQAL